MLSSSMKSPSELLSSLPTGISSDIGSCETRLMRRTLAAARFSARFCMGFNGSSIGNRLLDGDALFLRLDEIHFHRDFLGGWVSAQFLRQIALHPQQTVDAFDHVHGDADRAGLVGDGAADRLANPPGGVGAEFEAQLVIEFLDRPQQAQVAFLNQIQEAHAPADVALGHAHHQAQVTAPEFLCA